MAASPRSIMEGTVLPIRDFIKANIAAALSNLRTERGDGKVQTSPPKAYLIFDQAIGYEIPCIFVIGDTSDMRLDRGQNFIAAQNTVYVSALVEDRNAENLTMMCWRYSDALHAILDGAQIDIPLMEVKNIIKVVKIEYSNTFQMKQQNQDVFRKEVMLTLEVEHLEKR